MGIQTVRMSYEAINDVIVVLVNPPLNGLKLQPCCKKDFTCIDTSFMTQFVTLYRVSIPAVLSTEKTVSVTLQGSAKRRSPGSVNAAG